MNILWDADPEALEKYRFALGTDTQALDSAAMVARVLHDNPGIQQVVIGPDVPLDPACELAEAARLDRPELGVILLRHRIDVTTLSQALRSGVREVVTADDHTALADALRRSRDLTSRLLGHAAAGPGNEGHIVTVFSAKGGVGKTTLSTNIGHLPRRDRAEDAPRRPRPQPSVTSRSACSSSRSKSVFDAVAHERPPRRAGPRSRSSRRTRPAAWTSSARPNDPSDADRIPVNVVTELLKVARQHYDYVIVDTPPSFTEHVLAACDISCALVLIATLDIPAVKNLRVAIDTLDMLGQPEGHPHHRAQPRRRQGRAAARRRRRRDQDADRRQHPELDDAFRPRSTGGSRSCSTTPRGPVSAAIRELS